MKTKHLLLLFLIPLMSFSVHAQSGLGNVGNPSGGGQPGSERNPYNHLYVNDYIKIGRNSLWLNSAPQVGGTGDDNRIFSTNGPLYINGVHAANGGIPASTGSNTLINPQNGMVGIGLSTPTSKLDISLSNNFTYENESGLRLTYPIPFLDPNIPPINQNIFEIRQKTFGTNFSTKMVVTLGGNVGIGISNPDDKIHVHNGRIKITGTNSFGGPMILFGGSSTEAPSGQWGIEYIPQQNGAPGLNFWKPFGSTNGSGAGGFGNYFLFLADNGQVGIGTDPADFTDLQTSGYRLHVRNGIITEKLKIQLIANWPDYVFANDYQLRTLEEVEHFIVKNNHLPDVPSAEEVGKNGLNVAEMDATLLRKIEELTLYMIELKRINDEQNKKIEKLEIELNNVKTK